MKTARWRKSKRRWGMGGLTFITLVCICGSVKGWTGAQNPAGSRARSESVWTETPVLPWSGEKAGASGWSRLLNEKLDLTRKGRVGEQNRYRIRRQHIMLDRQGHVLTRSVSEGTVKRVLLRQEQPGQWKERMEWEQFSYGQSQGPNDAPKLQEQKQARGIAYDFSPRTFDYLNPPGDFARIPDPIIGYSLKVLGMDVAGFDAMLLPLHDKFGARMQIGDTLQSGRWAEAARIGQDPGKEVGGHYQLGEATTTLVGITRCQGVPCALIWFSAEGNSVKQETNTPQFTLHMDGTEYFRAEIAVSLLDGHIVAAEVWGPVISRMEIGQGKQPLQELPNVGVVQQVSLWEIR